MRCWMSACEMRTLVVACGLLDGGADLVRERARLGEHLRARSSVSTLAVAHQHLAVHDRRPHVVAAGDVDECETGSNIGVCRAADIDTIDQVGALARLRASRSPCPCPSARAPSIVAISSATGAGIARGSPSTSLCRNAAWRIASNMSRSLLLAAPSVPRPTRDAGLAHRLDRRDAAGELHVALGVVRDADAARAPDRRCRPASARRRARRACAGPRSRATPGTRSASRWYLSSDGLDLVLRLGQVDDHRDASAGRRARGDAFSVSASSVYIACGATAGVISSSPANSFANRSVARQALRRRLRVGHRELDDRLPEHAAQAGRLRHAGDLLLEVIHVRVGGRARTRSSRAPRAACRRGRTPATRSWLRPGRCTSAASPSAPGRRPARGTAPSARACGC